MLTVKREDACCVKRNYVRSIYDYFSLSEDESKNRTEALKIEPFYITNWEKLHDTYVGVKRPEDLTVCYLCGPEPDNDFKEFMNLGVLPHNIWGFEVNSQNYNKAKGSSKSDIICQYYYANIAKKDVKDELKKFQTVIKYLKKFYRRSKVRNKYLSNSKLFYEVLYWGTSIVLRNKNEIKDEDIEKVYDLLDNASQCDEIWQRIINNSQKNIELIFEPNGSHYYSAINNRYNLVANIFQIVFNIDFQKHLKDSESFKNIMNQGEIDEIKHYKINKPLPETLTIEDIISDMKKSRFLIRPDYQRSEVKNLQKASYLMESILLGINIPPLFVYKRADKVKEVVDGQQRLLTILGFLGRTYVDERGGVVNSNKDRFKLTKIKILSELEGKSIENIGSNFEEKVLEFPMDIIEIDYEQNPDFSPIDLFLRLNTKPYPIKENTFEMWNAYVDKDIVIKVKSIANKYEKKVFRAKDNRMKLEELITSLAYIDYRMNQPNTDICNVLNIYKRNDRMCSRIMSKDNVTKTLSDLSINSPKLFISALDNVELFIEKILLLIDNDTDRMRDLFNHSRKGTLYKTDQNYYFLWAMLFNITLEEIKINKACLFENIKKFFQIAQKVPNECTVEKFINMLSIKLK